MDSVFQLSNGDRASYLHNLMHSFGCSYICLWAFSPDHNCLYFEAGFYREETTSQLAASSSSGSLARRLFDDYKQSVFTVGNDLVPGLAFKHRNPYLELQELELQRLASIESQRIFYQEASIKIAVFLGCERGEIEMGISFVPQNMEMKIQNLFPQDFARLQTSPIMEIPRPTDQNRPSSSSSLSMDSPEYSSLLYVNPSSSSYLQEQTSTQTPLMEQPTTTKTQLILNQLQNIPFPTPESTDDALTRAYLAILSSCSSSTSSQQAITSQQSSLPYGNPLGQRLSAFKKYSASLGLSSSQTRSNLRRQNMLKRAIAYFRGLNYRRMQEHPLQGSRPTSTQLHHMISERRRREKINESYQALRSLLPQGTKKDKASVLRATKEYLSSLKAQVSELNKKNQLLEAKVLPTKNNSAIKLADVHTNERLNISINPVPESSSSSSGERIVDLEVILRGDNNISATDLIIRVLEFLKQVREASLVSMEAQTQEEITGADQSPTTWVTFRLRIEGTEWDESAFKEAVRRILADFAQQ